MTCAISPSAVRAVVSTLLLLTMSGCNDEDACVKHKNKVESCDRVFRKDVCAEEGGRCAVACFARVACDEWTAIDSGELPDWLSRCLTKCVEPFKCKDGTTINSAYQCDAASDCADGSDEVSCDYHTCDNGQRVRLDSECDGYSACADGSDEEGCP